MEEWKKKLAEYKARLRENATSEEVDLSMEPHTENMDEAVAIATVMVEKGYVDDSSTLVENP